MAEAQLMQSFVWLVLLVLYFSHLSVTASEEKAHLFFFSLRKSYIFKKKKENNHKFVAQLSVGSFKLTLLKQEETVHFLEMYSWCFSKFWNSWMGLNLLWVSLINCI